MPSIYLGSIFLYQKIWLYEIKLHLKMNPTTVSWFHQACLLKNHFLECLPAEFVTNHKLKVCVLVIQCFIVIFVTTIIAQTKIPSWRFSYDGEDDFAHEKAYLTVPKLHGYLHDIVCCDIQGVWWRKNDCDISWKKNKLLTKVSGLLYFFLLYVEIKFRQPFLFRPDTQLDIDLGIRWVSVWEVIIN